MSEALFVSTEDKYGLPRGLLNAVWQKESAGGKYMLSPAGAQGHFQFMPATAKQYSLADPNDLTQSADAAGRYFRDLKTKYDGDVKKMLAAYNWGPNNVDKKGLEKMPAETRDYVAAIEPKLSPQGMAAKVAAAKKEGYTDQEIFNYLANSEKHSAKIAAAKAEGYTEAEIAKHLGLKFDDLTGATASRYPTAAEVKSAPASGWANAGTGLKKSVLDTVAGTTQLVQEAGTARQTKVPGTDVKLTSVPSPFLGGLSVARGLANAAGLPIGTTAQDASILKQATTERHKDEAPAMSTWQGIAGNAAGTISQLALGGAGSPSLKEWLLMPDKAYKAFSGGAGFGFNQATGEGESRTQNALISGIGATAGYGLGLGLGKLYNTVKGFLASGAKAGGNQALDAAADSIIADAFQRSKVPMKDVSPEALTGLRQQIAEALRANPNPSQDVVSRMADFAALNIRGTKGQLTQDPLQWSKEFGQRQLRTREANPLVEQYTEGWNKLTGKMRAMGANESQPFSTGQTVIDDIQKADKAVSEEIAKLYKSAKDAAGRGAQMDTAGFSKRVNDFLDSERIGTFLPGEIRGILNDISGGKIPFTVDTMHQYQTILANALRSAQRQGDGNAVNAIRGTIQALVDTDVSSTAGEAAKQASLAAKAAARARFKSLDASPGLAAAVDNAAPDKFFQQYILNPNAKVREVSEMLRYMKGGAPEAPNQLLMSGPEAGNKLLLEGPAKQTPEAVSAIRQELLSHLLEKLQKGQATYANTLKAIGDEKLSLLLGPDDVAMLKTISRVAEAMDKAPKGAVPPRSGTAGEAFNLMHDLISKFTNLPGINMARDSIRNYAEGRSAQSALGNPLMDLAPKQPANRLISGAGAAAGTGASRR